MLIIHATRMLWPAIEKGAKVLRYFRVMLGKGSAYTVECFAGNFIGVDFDLDIDLADKLPENGAAVGLVDTLTCPTVWLPVLCEDQAGMDRLS
jgi:hypothetical protein